MAASAGFVAFVTDQLEGCGPITTRRMFGGVGMYSGDLFFAIVADDALYLKVDDSNRRDFERAGCRPFRPYGEGGAAMQYYAVPIGVLEDADALARWGRKAIAVAAAARSRTRHAVRLARVERRPVHTHPSRGIPGNHQRQAGVP